MSMPYVGVEAHSRTDRFPFRKMERALELAPVFLFFLVP